MHLTKSVTVGNKIPIQFIAITATISLTKSINISVTVTVTITICMTTTGNNHITVIAIVIMLPTNVTLNMYTLKYFHYSSVKIRYSYIQQYIYR